MDEHAFPIMLAWKLGVTDKANYNAHIEPAVNLRGAGSESSLSGPGVSPAILFSSLVAYGGAPRIPFLLLIGLYYREV